jgi:RNA 3'-terminal phosphate cyclase (ATP)
MTSDMILLDGSIGEGGGQMLRTALALSAVTGRPFQMNRVRAGRAKPGLMRQHLTCVTAAQLLCDADVRGAALHSTSVSFAPRRVTHGDRRIDIGTAGSACLVLQTVLPPLLHAAGRSRITITGGTHNPMAPTADFLVRAFVPALARMGASVDVDVVRPGFFPAGGGKLVLRVEGGGPLLPLTLVERGAVARIEARAYVDRLPRTIAERELAALAARFAGCDAHVVELAGAGPGNAVVVDVVAAHGTEVFSALGEQKRSSEAVVSALADEVDAFVAADVPVGEHLADQLLIPLALAGAGRFRTVAPTPHTLTNIDMVQRFLPVRFTVDAVAGGNVDISVAPA